MSKDTETAYMTIDRSDEELMLRYRDGDKTAFETLYSRYEKPLFDFIYRMVPDSTETESLFQETFLRLVRARRRYRPSAQFKTWLFQIAVNLCRDRSRKMKHRSHLSLNSPRNVQENGHSELQDVIPDPKPAVDKSVEDGELQSAVKEALSALPEDEQLVVILREFQGMKYSEIAEVMNRPVGTLKSINHRAHERLRHALIPYLKE